VAAANGPPARPLQTGQTSCYDASGNLSNTIPCAGTGQDGATQTGVVRRYIDNGDGTITDTQTGLMWEKKSNDGGIHNTGNQYTWSDAFAVFITALDSAQFAGHSDWRLPNVNELQSIANYGTTYPAVDAVFNTSCAATCTVTTCSCTSSYFYWSSTTSQGTTTTAWAVYFVDGYVDSPSKTLSNYVRAVRGGL